MASQEVPSIDDMQKLDSSPSGGDESDSEWLDLDAGESVVGEVRRINPDAGQYETGVIELSRGLGDTVVLWTNGNLKTLLRDHEIGEGEVIGIKRAKSDRKWTDDDGEEHAVKQYEVYQR